jgi:hypothetical protein
MFEVLRGAKTATQHRSLIALFQKACSRFFACSPSGLKYILRLPQMLRRCALTLFPFLTTVDSVPTSVGLTSS